MKGEKMDYIFDNEFSSIFFMDRLLLSDIYISLNYNIFSIYFTYETIKDSYNEIPNSIKPIFDTITEDDNPLLAIVKFRDSIKN